MNINLKINQAIRRLHAQVDSHTQFHLAGIVNYAESKRQEIYGSIENYNRHYGQIRRWREFRKFNGGGKNE